VSEINQQVQEELKIEVESLSAMRRERLSMQEELRMEREGRESERARLLEIQQRIASLAWREAEREEELNAERETLEEVEAREAGKRAVLEAQLSEAKKRESEVEMREQQKRAALEEELRSATASISRLECKDVIACEKTSALEVQLKKAQEVVKALEVDAKAEKEKHATTMAQEQERADTNSMRVSELTIELKAARECLLHLERREKEAVARLEVLNRRFPLLQARLNCAAHSRVHHLLRHSYYLYQLLICACKTSRILANRRVRSARDGDLSDCTRCLQT
jgi:hypothetical protein